MARVTGDDQTCASTTSLLESRTSNLRDSRQTDCDVMSVLINSEADVLLANLAYGHDRNFYNTAERALQMQKLGIHGKM